MTEAQTCTLSIILHSSAAELKELNYHIQTENVSSETYVKRAICALTNGQLFSNAWSDHK